MKLNLIFKTSGLTIAIISVVANEDGDIQTIDSTSPVIQSQLHIKGNRAALQNFVTCSVAGIDVSNQLRFKVRAGSFNYTVERS